nr:PREDICTED: zinc finger protein 845-like isoform X2 [Bemisia tabaci]
MELQDHGYSSPSVSTVKENSPVKIEPPDFSHLCRICANRNEYLIPIFEGEGIQLDLKLRVEKYLPLTIDPSDELPSSMCYQCASSITSWHDLFESCITAEKQLKDMKEGRSNEKVTPESCERKEENDCDSTSPNIKGSILQTLLEEQTNSPDFSPPASPSMDDVEEVPSNNMNSTEASSKEVTSEKSLARRRPNEKATKVSKSKEEKDDEFLFIIPETKLVEGEKEIDLGKRKRKQASHLNSDFIYDGLSHAEKDEPLPKETKTLKSKRAKSKQTNAKEAVNDRSKCRFCSKTYSRSRDTIRHERIKHGKGTTKPQPKKQKAKTSSAKQQPPKGEEVSLTCDKCQVQLKNKLAMVKHLKEVHADLFSIEDGAYKDKARCRSYLCNICSYLCKGRKLYIKHHRLEHPGQDEDFVRESTEPRHPCMIGSCESAFTRRHDLFRHQRNKHPESIIVFENTKVLRKIIICQICRIELQREEDAEQHVKHDHDVKEHEIPGNLALMCSICKSLFDSVTDLVTHANVLHNDVFTVDNHHRASTRSSSGDASGARAQSPKPSPATCDVCGLTFKHRNKLMQHRSRHITMEDRLKLEPVVQSCKVMINNEPNFRCNICSRLITKEDQFFRHLILHARSKAFCCHLCGFQFFTKARLTRHVDVFHLKKREFKCDICGHAFAEKQAMEDHRRTHTGERPYQCKICGKWFPSHTCVYSHKRSHTDYFPYHCSEPNCSSRFRTQYRLKEHMRRHTGEKPFKCPYESCPRMFHDKRAIKRHLTVHSNARPHTCSICNRTYKHQKYLSFHIKANHGLTMTEYNDQFSSKLNQGVIFYRE